MLCSVCLFLIRQIDDTLNLHHSGELSGYQNLSHHQTVDSIVHAVETSRCAICVRVAHEAPGLLDRDLDHPRLQDGSLGLEYSALANLRTWPRNTEISLRFMTRGYGGMSAFRLRSLPDLDVTALTLHPSSLSSYTGDDAVLDLARTWLDRCETEHEDCQLHFQPDITYPARLLDLEPEELKDGLHFRLIEGQAMQGVSGSYITLSHRWGTPEKHPPKLNAISYKSLVQGWPIQRLSGTYQDAVSIIKKLDVRYMWVDSLCIFQDEQLDILTEALKMATVYGNAVCNISALDARQDGLFTSRDPTHVSPSSHIVSNTEHTELQRSYAIGDHRLWDTSVFGSLLSRRGWILQEQLLARRTLFFGHEQLLWSCISGAWCETYPMKDGVWDNSNFGLSQGHFEPVRLYCAAVNRATSCSSQPSSLVVIDPELKRDFQNAWRHVIEEYVSRELTKPSDKLLAITGIVSSFTATQDDELIAGHWRSSFPFNLLWHVRNQEHFTQHQSDFRANESRQTLIKRFPSWSWASQNVRLIIPGELDLKNSAPIAKVLNIEQDPRTLASNGACQEEVPVLTLVSPQLPLIRMQDEGKETWDFEASPTMPPPPSTDPSGDHLTTYFDLPDSEILTDSLTAVFVSCEVGHSRAASSNLASSAATIDRGMKSLIRCQGLILRPLPPSSETSGASQYYTRIGHFDFGEIMTGSSADFLRSRFMPLHWRFHLDTEERGGSTFTRTPDFDDGRLMHTVQIV